MDIFQRKHLSSIISGHNKNDLRWHWNREIQSALSEKWFFFSIGWIFAHLSWLMEVQVQVHLKMLTGWTAHLSHRLFSAERGRVRSPFALRPLFLSFYLFFFFYHMLIRNGHRSSATQKRPLKLNFIHWAPTVARVTRARVEWLGQLTAFHAAEPHCGEFRTCLIQTVLQDSDSLSPTQLKCGNASSKASQYWKKRKKIKSYSRRDSSPKNEKVSGLFIRSCSLWCKSRRGLTVHAFRGGDKEAPAPDEWK